MDDVADAGGELSHFYSRLPSTEWDTMLLRTRELVSQMQSAEIPVDAERIRWMLEAHLHPNQVLHDGAADLVDLLLDGLPAATAAGKMESWETLAQIAAGTAGPTAAETQVIEVARAALAGAVAVAVERVSSESPEPYDFLAVDVLDVMLDYAQAAGRAAIIRALERFADRGAHERRRVSVIWGNPGQNNAAEPRES
jgi:hypothetical protein